MPEEKLAGYALDPTHPRGRHTSGFASGVSSAHWMAALQAGPLPSLNSPG
ncbi:MAG: hypothetical protein M3401_13910 [Actinomycetota bacterium]|nr:hypothetical protein [Actinomycetota bacterium]